MQIPGSTDAEHEARYKAYEQDRDVILAVEREKTIVEASWRVYLAKVNAVASSSPNSGVRTLSVKPAWQVRGTLPASVATVEEGPLTSCAYRFRALRGTKVGDLIIIFEQPGTVIGMRADEARSGELVDAIDMYALSLEKKAS